MQCNNENKKKFYERIFMKLKIIQHNKVNVTYDTIQREMTLVTNVT